MFASFESYWRLTKTKNMIVINLCSLMIFFLLSIHVVAAGQTSQNVEPKPSSSEEALTSGNAKEINQQADLDSVDTLPEVSVKDKRVKEESGINPTQSITVITPEQLQRMQSSNIFEAVRSAPGVTTSGGPRASGMTFSIRGFADGEDVMVKVDGAPKAFEKYRMGGTFIEPELLRSIEIQRGPQITSGSGALGGTIIAETKNAADFLRPGQKIGAKAKFGYGSNNDEYSRSYMLYARPDERVDILYNYSNRQSNNITLADKTKLENSAIQSISELLKVSLFPTDDLEIITSLIKFTDSGLQPYDATGGQPGLFGNVIRATNDFSWTEIFNYRPDNPWVNFKATLAGGYTDLHDVIKQGMSVVNPSFSFCNGTTYIPNPSDITRCGGDLNDYYKYNTKTVDLSNTSIIAKTKNLELSLLAGWQYNSRVRDVSRFYENQNASAQVNNYPEGENLTAPSGERSFKAFYLQPNIQWGQLNIKPGYRRDDYKVEATGDLTRQLLLANGQSPKLDFTEETFSLALSYDFFSRNSPEKLTVYSNYAQGFRPALLDESYTAGGFGSRCQALPSTICGDLYVPQQSESTEAGISYQNPRLWGTDLFITSKLNFYHIYTSDLLLSMRYDPIKGKYTQDGWERRNGVELESFMQYQGWYFRGSYSRINGGLYDGVSARPLYTIPGNALNVNIGKQITRDIDVNLSYRKISDRDVIVSGDGTALSPYAYGVQGGYELWNAGISWRTTNHLTMRIVGENLTNNEYRFDSAFGGLGILGPGRNVKVFVELMY
jgi:hemoglobin/transferrin/lactoferrin receptor protein